MRKLTFSLLIASAILASTPAAAQIMPSGPGAVLPLCCEGTTRDLLMVRDSRRDPSFAARRLNRLVLYRVMRQTKNPVLTPASCREFRAARQQVLLPRILYSASVAAQYPTCGIVAILASMNVDEKDRQIRQICRAVA